MDMDNNRVSERDRHLVEFAQLLRSVGLRVSPSEISDATEGLRLIGKGKPSKRWLKKPF